MQGHNTIFVVPMAMPSLIPACSPKDSSVGRAGAYKKTVIRKKLLNAETNLEIHAREKALVMMGKRDLSTGEENKPTLCCHRYSAAR